MSSASSSSSERYAAVAIVLHWAIAAAILFMLPLGFWMHDQAESGAVTPDVYRAFQLHKSIGLTVLALSLLRLGWRLANPPPPLPAHMPGWERFAAKATHWVFYALMLGLPLSGWLFVSAGWSLHEGRSLAVPTHFFGLFQVPALFDLPRAGEETRAAVAEAAFAAHALMAWAAIALAGLHVAAALKHHLFDKDNVLTHMIPALRPLDGSPPAPKNPARLAVIGTGLGLTGIALAAATFALIGPSAPAPQESSSIEIAEAPVREAAPEAQAPAASETQPPAAAAPSAPAAWRVDAGASSIRFNYAYTDESGETAMNGRFTRWRADIRFDAANLDASSAAVTIETASADTGAPYHNSTLPNAGWFNSAAHPNATFRTSEIRTRDGGYEARGRLTIRGQSRDVRLPFTLAINGDRAVMDGRVTIQRADFGLGAGAEGDDMIGPDVTIVVHVEAVRAP
ncbi:MAG TPA: YceI family protein [Terricaulis sp.]|nr:YceI family protein [Terricaulis sp.]